MATSADADFLWVKEGRVRGRALEEEPFVPRVFWHLRLWRAHLHRR